MTNGDRLRAMSDEDLAELMVTIRYDTAIEILNILNGSMRGRDEVLESVIGWMQEEVKEDE